MSEHYDFHYQPTGSGAISGQQVLQQTEDAINELGDYVNDNVGGAMDVAQQALETAQTAETNAQTALDTANSFSDAIQSAQQDASTALSTAQTAQTTASNANNTAIQAQQDANTAVTIANNASGQVSTLSGTVTTLGQRVTTAEGNIGQNTSDITALGQRVTTAEGNITTLQNDVSIAQGNASSAMATAGQVKQQAFVFRYSSTALTPSSTNSNTLLDNTDNLKVGDKVIDSSGVLFSITAIDTQNSTFTIGTALIDLAQDSDVVHKSGNETVGGEKTFTDNISLKSLNAEYGVSYGYNNVVFKDKNDQQTFKIVNDIFLSNTNNNYASFLITQKVNDVYYTINGIQLYASGGAKNVVLRPAVANSNVDGLSVSLGSAGYKFANIYGTKYYYGTNNVEFSEKFITADTAQTVSANKTFSVTPYIYNSDDTGNTPYLVFKSSKAIKGDTGGFNSDGARINHVDKNDKILNYIQFRKATNGSSDITFYSSTIDGNSQEISSSITFFKSVNGQATFRAVTDNDVNLGNATYKWKDVNTYLVNGLAPSSLSMPTDNVSNIIDISSYMTILDGSSANTYQAPDNGYISVTMNGSSGIQGYITGFWGSQVVRSTVGVTRFFMPICKNMTANILIFGGTIDNARFIPCQGNV